MKNRRTSGISLVALIVTIIVLIILTAAVIVTFMEGGIIEKAKEAVFKSDIRTYQEILAVKNAENMITIATGNGEGTLLNGITLEEIQEIIPEFKEEYGELIAISNGEIVLGSESKEPYSQWLAELGIGNGETKLPENAIATIQGLDVGDYVVYSPEGNNVTSYQLKGIDSGYFVNSTTEEVVDQEITRQNINWRVLKNNGTQVTLISETPIDNIGLGGKLGFLNGARLLDDIYETLYSGSKGIARNLNMEDIYEVMRVETAYSYYNDVDGNGVELKLGATFEDAINDAGYDISDWSMPDENYRNYVVDYSSAEESDRARNEEGYKLIYRDIEDINNIGIYWLSSSAAFVFLDADYAEFGMKVIDDGAPFYQFLDDSGDYYFTMSYSGRPIVILNSDVIVTNPTAGGDTLSNAWQLK